MREFRYGIIGRGRWGATIAAVLRGYSRPVQLVCISRREINESSDAYLERLRQELHANTSNVDIVWIAVPPGNQDSLVKSVLELNKNVVVEKPWMCGYNETIELISIAHKRGLQVAVDYQFCLLEALSNICRGIDKMSSEIVFSGEFTISRDNRLSIPDIYNLGSHLLAVKCLLFPKALIGSIKTGYNQPDRRIIRIIFKSGEFIINFLNNREPLVERFIDAFEDSLANNRELPINLKLALEVNNELLKLEAGRYA